MQEGSACEADQALRGSVESGEQGEVACLAGWVEIEKEGARMTDFTMDEWADEFNTAWGQAEPAESTGGPVPDGQYNTVIDRALVKQSKRSNRPMLEITLKILGPTHAKRLLWLTHMLDREQGYPYLKADLELLGVNIATLTELPDRLEDVIGLRVKVTVKNKGEFSNIYLNELIEAVDLGGPAGEGGGVDEDGLPF